MFRTMRLQIKNFYKRTIILFFLEIIEEDSLFWKFWNFSIAKRLIRESSNALKRKRKKESNKGIGDDTKEATAERKNERKTL